jgi:hypothetical protein
MLHQASSRDESRAFDLELPLQPATDNAEHVAILLRRVLGLVDEFCRGQQASEADVIQALTVATALRAAMIEVSRDIGNTASPRLLDIDVQDASRSAA